MPFYLTLLILLAAFLHAAWNALLRASEDRMWSITVMCLAVALASATAALVLEPPASASWSYAALSAVLHVGYNVFLVQSYRVGDLGQSYPIARGSSPVLVTIGASLLVDESLGAPAMLGIALVSGGIISLAFGGRKLQVPTLPYTLGTGGFIAAYSIVDGIGARMSGAPLAYTAWMCMLWGVLMTAAYFGLRGWSEGKRLLIVRPGFATAFVGGLVSLLAYSIVIFAMAKAPMGAVSALRETSVLFAALIGYFFLGERLTALRLVACAAIATGTVLIR